MLKNLVYNRQITIYFKFLNSFQQLSQMKLLILFYLFIAFTLAAYNESIASTLVKASKNTELSKEQIEDYKCSICESHITNTIFFSHEQKQLQGFAAYSTKLKQIIIAFSGSRINQNWRNNLKINLIGFSKCQNCMVHQGFINAAIAISPFVLAAVRNLTNIYGRVPVLITGHSLGGALASLVGINVIEELKLGVSIYTFGSPRVGNKNLALYKNKKFSESYRVVFMKDSIPHIPPKKLGFAHMDTQIWFRGPKMMQICKGDQQNKCSNEVSLLLLKNKDHDLINYLNLYQDQRKLNLDTSKQIQGMQGYQLLSIYKDIQMLEIPENAN